MRAGSHKLGYEADGYETHIVVLLWNTGVLQYPTWQLVSQMYLMKELLYGNWNEGRVGTC